MNYWFLAAAGLSALTFVAHVFGGGPEIHVPVLQSQLSDYFKAIFSVIWHAISAILILNSLVLASAAMNWPGSHYGAMIVAGQYLSFAILFVFYGLNRLDTLTVMPQWVVFTAIPVLIFFALRSCKQPLAKA